MTHEIKIWPQYFERVKDGSKTFEVRENDRGYQPGDIVVLKEFDKDNTYTEYSPGGFPLGEVCKGFTGRWLEFKIGYILPIDEKRIVVNLTMNDFDFFIFWDKQNDEPEILDEAGEFYYYNEDSVEIEQSDGEKGRRWTRLEKLCDVTPLNHDWARFQILDWETGEWVEWGEANHELICQVQKLAGVKEWWDYC